MAAPIKRQGRARVEPWVGPWLRSVRVGEFDGRDKEGIAKVAARVTRLGEEPVVMSTLSRIERGETFFPADELPRFLAAYKVTVADFAAQGRAAKRQTGKRAA
jgi:hypothetical protein